MAPPDFGFLIPTVPHGYQAWDAFTTLLYMGVFKIARGVIMKRRSTYVDRVGWSFIGWDIVVGSAFVLACLWALYPALMFHTIGPVIVNICLKAMTTWQVYEVTRAPTQRVEAATSGSVGDNGYNSYDGAERRLWIRRRADREKESVELA